MNEMVVIDNKRRLLSDDMKCEGCEAKIKEGSEAYYGTGDKTLYCKQCINKGMGSDHYNEGLGFYPVNVYKKVVGGDDNKAK